MVSTKLPDIQTFNDKLPELKENIVLSVNSQAKYSYPEHRTPYLFVANFHGKGCYVANQKKIEVSDRYFYFLNNNDKFEITFKESVPRQTFFILFNTKFIDDCFGSLLKSDEQLLSNPQVSKTEVVIPTVPFSYNASLLGKIFSLSELKHSKCDRDDLLFELIADFSLLINATKKIINRVPAVKRTTKEEIYTRIFLAMEILNDCVSEKKTLDVIAEAVCMNKFHFLANFKRVTGTTPHQYVTQIRLHKAFDLLQNKHYTVSEVCYMLNFESLGSFSNLFKKKFFVSPSQIPNIR